MHPDITLLYRFAWRDVAPSDGCLGVSGENGIRREFGAVVGNNHSWEAAAADVFVFTSVPKEQHVKLYSTSSSDAGRTAADNQPGALVVLLVECLGSFALAFSTGFDSQRRIRHCVQVIARVSAHSAWPLLLGLTSQRPKRDE